MMLLRLLSLSLLGLAVAGPTGAAAAQGGRPDSGVVVQGSDSTADTTSAGAAVVVGGDTVLLIRAGMGPLSPTERALGIAERMDRLERDPELARDSITIKLGDAELLISVGEHPLMSVRAADALAAGIGIDSLARSYRSALAAHFARESGQFRLKALLMSIIFAILATLVALLLVWLLRRLFDRLTVIADRLRHSRRLSVRFQQLELISPHHVANISLVVVRGVRFAAYLLLAYFYVVLVLSLFAVTRTLSSQIIGYVLTPLGVVGESVLGYLPKLFFLALIILVTRWVLRGIRFIFRAIGNGAITIAGFERDWSEPTYKLVRVVVLVFSLVVLWPYLPGSGSDAFKGISIFVGVIFSLGSTGVMSNLVAGTLLTYTRSFNIGDRVRIGETLGDVVGRTLLVTRIRSLTNVEVTIPNSQVMGCHVLNYSAMAAKHGVALQVAVTIGYEVPWRRVHELLLEAAQGTEGIADTPEPFVLQVGLDDSYPRYELNAYTNDAVRMRFVLSALNSAIQDGFAKGGVEITSPAYLAVRKGDESTIPK